jgi:hypothetical protein
VQHLVSVVNFFWMVDLWDFAHDRRLAGPVVLFSHAGNPHRFLHAAFANSRWTSMDETLRLFPEQTAVRVFSDG